MPVDQAHLEVSLRKWQRILRLRDWDVKIQLERAFKLPNRQAEVTWVKTQKTALIKILEPGDYDSELGVPQDVEQCVVHELLHLHFAPIDKFEGVAELLLEQAIDSIAWALVNCDRKAGDSQQLV